jgi:hypothetical protein
MSIKPKSKMKLEDHLETADCFAVAWDAIERARERGRYCLPKGHPALLFLERALAELDRARDRLDEDYYLSATDDEFKLLRWVYYRLERRAKDILVIPVSTWAEMAEEAGPRHSDYEIFGEWRRECCRFEVSAQTPEADIYRSFRAWWGRNRAGVPWPIGKLREMLELTGTTKTKAGGAAAFRRIALVRGA